MGLLVHGSWGGSDWVLAAASGFWRYKMSHQTGIRGNYRCNHVDFILWGQTLLRYNSQHPVKMNFIILEMIKRIVHNIN